MKKLIALLVFIGSVILLAILGTVMFTVRAEAQSCEDGCTISGGGRPGSGATVFLVDNRTNQTITGTVTSCASGSDCTAAVTGLINDFGPVITGMADATPSARRDFNDEVYGTSEGE